MFGARRVQTPVPIRRCRWSIRKEMANRSATISTGFVGSRWARQVPIPHTLNNLPGGYISMHVRLILIVISIVLALTASAAKAVTSVKKINLLHNQTSSPFFTKNPTNTVTLTSFTSTDATSSVTFTPVGTVQAGQVTSLVSNG